MPIIYNKSFYNARQDGSLFSAENVIPFIFDIFQPCSVIDLGCGIGTWLSVFKNKYAVKEILGVDGDYVDINMLKIEKNEFIPYNLEKVFTPPKRFDVAMSLEVGEHLPDSCAENLVKSLTDASDFIMFSAALPGQTGTNHINEQVPEYWAKKFNSRGYICIDYIRKNIWDITGVDAWYKQNIILYIKKSIYEIRFEQKLSTYKDKTDPEFLIRVHPDLLIYFKDKFYQTRSLLGFIKYHLGPLKKLILGQNRK